MEQDNNFIESMKFVSLWEWGDRPDGALTNHPQDRGGLTKYGIAQSSHPDLDVQTLTLGQALQLYYTDYWCRYGCPGFPMPLATVRLDCFVNHSPKTAEKLLDQTTDPHIVLRRRKQFYGELVNKNPSQSVFLKGWLNRANDLDKFCSIWELKNGRRR